MGLTEQASEVTEALEITNGSATIHLLRACLVHFGAVYADMLGIYLA